MVLVFQTLVKAPSVGLHTFNNRSCQNVISYTHPVSITNCELMAVFEILMFIKNNNQPTHYTINIYTDCQVILQYLSFEAYPKYNHIKLIIQTILKLLSIIQKQNPALHIHLKKVKSHTNIPGNIKVDKLVRNAAKNAKYIPQDINRIPYSVTLTQIHKYTNRTWKSKWKQKANPARLITKFHHKFDTRINQLISKSKLNRHQCGIMMRLITEHIELNKYLFFHNIKCPQTDQIPPSPNCNYCDQLETTNHFLINCRKYKMQRSKFFSKLNKINHKYQYKKFRTIKFILFPYLLLHNNFHNQTMVWKEILNYTKATNRFNNIHHIDTDLI